MAARKRAPVGAGYKGQPWVLFDTVKAVDFLVGGAQAIGTQGPAVTQQGEMVFFAAGRTRAQNPTLTNMDISGQLAYGMEVWQIYLRTMLPMRGSLSAVEGVADLDPSKFNTIFPQMAKLTEALLNCSVLDLDLGQEEQTAFPSLSYGAGGGIVNEGGSFVVHNSNGVQVRQNMLNLPEPVEMPRTQNLNVLLRLDPSGITMLGTPAAPGVGIALSNPVTFTGGPDGDTDVTFTDMPFAIQVGLVGRRVKKTQYGQIPGAGN